VAGILVPFRRDKKRDFATGSGPLLLASKVRQTLLTEGTTPRSSGELPWRTSSAEPLRCSGTSATMQSCGSWRGYT
jgi:hypothetical protein